MIRVPIIALVLLFTLFCQVVFAQKEEKEVMHVVHQFFHAMENNDSLTFRNVFLPAAYNYYVQEREDSIRVGSQSPFGLKLNKERVIREQFREQTVKIQVRRSIAMVWGTYDLSINDKFSHCGTDVFTLLRAKDGWKISSLSFSMEKGDCK